MYYRGLWDPGCGYKHRIKATLEPGMEQSYRMGGEAPANKAAMIQELGSRRENQGLGQKPVVRAENTPRTGTHRTCLQPRGQAQLPLSLGGQEPLTPKGICLTCTMDPKGLAHLLQKSWRSFSMPKLL